MRFISARSALGRGLGEGLPSPRKASVSEKSRRLSWGGQALPRPLPRALRAKMNLRSAREPGPCTHPGLDPPLLRSPRQPPGPPPPCSSVLLPTGHAPSKSQPPPPLPLTPSPKPPPPSPAPLPVVPSARRRRRRLLRRMPCSSTSQPTTSFVPCSARSALSTCASCQNWTPPSTG